MIKSQKMCPQYSSKYTLARHGCTGITQQFPVSGQFSSPTKSVGTRLLYNYVNAGTEWFLWDGPR